MIQVTPTGPWGKDVHPAMPLGLDELLADLSECLDAGATGVHLHVRDGSGAETLDPRWVNETCAAVRAAGAEHGVPVEIGLTTGEWIVPDLAERVAMIREWEGVDCATVNLAEDGYESVAQVMRERGIGVDVGLWDLSQIALLDTERLGPLFRVSIELDTEEPLVQTGDPHQTATRVNQALDALPIASVPRLTHGMTTWTWPLVRDAFARGHATRVGFEDSVFLPDRSRASSNADLVRAAVALRDAG